MKIEAATRLAATAVNAAEVLAAEVEARAHDMLTQIVGVLKAASVDILHQTTKEVLGAYYDVRDIEHILHSLKAKKLSTNHYLIPVPDLPYDLYVEIDPHAETVHLQYK